MDIQVAVVDVDSVYFTPDSKKEEEKTIYIVLERAPSVVAHKNPIYVFSSSKCFELYDQAVEIVASLPRTFQKINLMIVLPKASERTGDNSYCVVYLRLFTFLLLLIVNVKNRQLPSPKKWTWKRLRTAIHQVDKCTAAAWSQQHNSALPAITRHSLLEERQTFLDYELRENGVDAMASLSELCQSNLHIWETELLRDARSYGFSCVQYCWLLRSCLYRFCIGFDLDHNLSIAEGGDEKSNNGNQANCQIASEDLMLHLIDPCTMQQNYNFSCRNGDSKEPEHADCCRDGYSYHYFNTLFPMFVGELHQIKPVSDAKAKKVLPIDGALAMLIDAFAYRHNNSNDDYNANNNNNNNNRFDAMQFANLDFDPVCESGPFYNYPLQPSAAVVTDNVTDNGDAVAEETKQMEVEHSTVNTVQSPSNRNNRRKRFKTCSNKPPPLASVIQTVNNNKGDDTELREDEKSQEPEPLECKTTPCNDCSITSCSCVFTLLEQLVLYYLWLHEMEFTLFDETSFAIQHCFDNKQVVELSKEIVHFYKGIFENAATVSQVLENLKQFFLYTQDQVFSALTVECLQQVLQRFPATTLTSRRLFEILVQHSMYRRELTQRGQQEQMRRLLRKKQKLNHNNNNINKPNNLSIQNALNRYLDTFDEEESAHKYYLQHSSVVEHVMANERMPTGSTSSSTCFSSSLECQEKTNAAVYGNTKLSQLRSISKDLANCRCITESDIVNMSTVSKRLFAFAYSLWQQVLVKSEEMELVPTLLYHFFPGVMFAFDPSGKNKYLAVQPQLYSDSVVRCYFPEQVYVIEAADEGIKALCQVIQREILMPHTPSIINELFSSNGIVSSVEAFSLLEVQSVLQAGKFALWNSETQLVDFLKKEVTEQGREKLFVGLTPSKASWLFNVLVLHGYPACHHQRTLSHSILILRALRHFEQFKWVSTLDTDLYNWHQVQQRSRVISMRKRSPFELEKFHKQRELENIRASQRLIVYCEPHPQDPKKHLLDPKQWTLPHEQWLCMQEIANNLCDINSTSVGTEYAWSKDPLLLNKEFSKIIRQQMTAHQVPLLYSKQHYHQNKLKGIYAIETKGNDINNNNDNDYNATSEAKDKDHSYSSFVPAYALQDILSWLAEYYAAKKRKVSLAEVIRRLQINLRTAWDQKCVKAWWIEPVEDEKELGDEKELLNDDCLMVDTELKDNRSEDNNSNNSTTHPNGQNITSSSSNIGKIVFSTTKQLQQQGCINNNYHTATSSSQGKMDFLLLAHRQLSSSSETKKRKKI
jgi:hypothetical protein